MNWQPITKDNLPDSDTPVLVGSEQRPGFARLVLLEFTDDSEGHGETYWVEADNSGHDYPLVDFTHWCLYVPPRAQ